jgi:hypothetical protein
MNEGINEAANRPDEPSPNRTVRLESTQQPLAPHAAPTPHAAPAEQRQIEDLVQALSNPKHRAHRTAVDELVALGPAAVPALNAALSPDRPWLMAYRSAEALAQIGDGRATGALTNTVLRHPNSNVRWSAVQALSEIGDARSINALRRVARNDRGKTSWGEAVADTAQQALDRLQSRSIVLRFWEPLKTIVTAAAMFAALAFAYNQIQDLRREIRTPARPVAVLTPEEQTATAQAAEVAAASPTATPAPPTATPAPASPAANGVTGRVTVDSNFRNEPAIRPETLAGVVANGTDVQVLGRSGDWYRVRLQDNREGWITAIQVNVPNPNDVPQIQATATSN